MNASYLALFKRPLTAEKSVIFKPHSIIQGLMSREIHSPQNNSYKRWISLHDSRGIKKHSQCLVSGSRIVKEIIEQFPNLSLEGIISDRMKVTDSFPIQSYTLPHPLFKKLDLFGTNTPLLIAKVPKIRDFSSTHRPLGLEVLCGLGDSNNVGALARCCEAFKVRKLILLKSSVHPFHPKVIRSSSGSVFRIPIERGPSMDRIEFDVVALDRQGEKIDNFHWPKNARLLMGEEGQGLLPQLRATRVSLPMASCMDSLNAVSASSIALYSYYLSHGCPP